MFEQTFVNTTKRTKGPFAFAVSVAIEICGLAVLVLIPLVYTQALPSTQLKSILTAPRAPAPVIKVLTRPRAEQVAAPRHFSATLVAPRVIPKRINMNIQELHPAPAAQDMVSSIASEGNAATNELIYGTVPSPPPAPAAAPKPAPRAPIRVATGVAEANLIRKVIPVYPALAKAARVQGMVEFTAIINKEGRIENLRLVSGHPLLVQAAKDAVLQWSYRPTLLNGQPVEVVTDIFVNFTLSQ